MLRWSLATRMSWRSIRQLVRCWSSGARAPLPEGPGFKEFLSGTAATTSAVPQLENTPYLSHAAAKGLGRNRKVYFDVYGCQMNVNDTEVVWAILKKSGFTKTEELNEADIVLVMTCAIREGAETKVWNRLEYLKGLKNARTRKKSLPAMKIGIIGCMAERLKERLLERERAVDLVAGPDAYKDLPRLLALTDNNQTAVNVLLSLDETYADVMPVRLNQDSVTAFVDLSEVHHFGSASTDEETHMSRGFKTVYRPKRGGLRFADLLEKVSNVLHLIRERPNICNNLHLPAQSGNDHVLERMRRGYTRAAYLELVDHVRDVLPGVTLSSDFICGFCGETEQEFEDTLSLMERVQYHMAFLFPYSLREKTVAHRKLQDDVPSAVKQERLLAMVGLFRRGALKLNKEQIGRTQLILVEGRSKRSDQFLAGRNDGNTKVIIPADSVPEHRFSRNDRPIVSGDYVVVQINDASSQVLKGTPLYHSTLSEFQQLDIRDVNRSHNL
ncbi:CDK5RAP1-like protein [Gryllus bimaculatus]|nr:CDK5RAP1-like protein [Gryllus bimaculatus]